MSIRRRLACAVAAVLLTVSVTSCSSTEEDRRDDYCAAVKKASEKLIRVADEAGPRAFLELLPTLEELADQAPSDLRDEWQTYLTALRGLRDTLSALDLAPEDLSDGVPDGLGAADEKTLVAAVRNVRSTQTEQAASGITQQALDVCGTQIL